MNLETISKKTGKLTAKTLSSIVSAPTKSVNKSKQIKDAFMAGYESTMPKKPAKVVLDTEVIETSAV